MPSLCPSAHAQWLHPTHLSGAVVPSPHQGIAQMISFQPWESPGTLSLELSADQPFFREGCMTLGKSLALSGFLSVSLTVNLTVGTECGQ